VVCALSLSKALERTHTKRSVTSSGRPLSDAACMLGLLRTLMDVAVGANMSESQGKGWATHVSSVDSRFLDEPREEQTEYQRLQFLLQAREYR